MAPCVSEQNRQSSMIIIVWPLNQPVLAQKVTDRRDLPSSLNVAFTDNPDLRMTWQGHLLITGPHARDLRATHELVSVRTRTEKAGSVHVQLGHVTENPKSKR